jgi:hypothetical protein
MSLQRTALRLGAIGAILADPVLGPLLAGRAYDSRLSAFQSREFVPAVLVYTEDDSGAAFSSNGGPDFNRTCELTLEIAIRALDESGEDVAIPVTDAGMEAMLDQIEDRVVGSRDDLNNPGLMMAQTAFSRALRQHVIRRISKVESSRFVDDSTGEKYAFRIVVLSCELLTSGNENFAPTGLEPPFTALPVSLQALAAIAPAPASITNTLTQLAGRMAAPAPQDAFVTMGIALEVAPDGTPGPATETPDSNAPQFTANPSQS